MKKFSKLFLCSCVAISISGCSAGDILNSYTDTSETTSQAETSEAPKQRVYMDEIKGTLQDFTGASLTLISTDESQAYVFDLSEATLECEDGMITGDEISVIYEGQLSATDTSSVKALKVVDDFHKKNKLKIRKIYGEVQNLTSNTITIKNKKGKTSTYPITGTEQYYQNGIHSGVWVYIHFKGQLSSENSQNSSNLKVLSVSDIDPLKSPENTPAPDLSTDSGENAKQEKQLHAVIQNINSNTLTVQPSGSENTLDIDLTQIPSYFKGGTSPGSYVTITYTGEPQEENSLKGTAVTSVTGDDPYTARSHNITYTVSGIIIGHTANTITLQTTDGAAITCFTDEAKNTSTSGFSLGASIRITFDPSKSSQSNIYTSVKIEDA